MFTNFHGRHDGVEARRAHRFQPFAIYLTMGAIPQSHILPTCRPAGPQAVSIYGSAMQLSMHFAVFSGAFNTLYSLRDQLPLRLHRYAAQTSLHYDVFTSQNPCASTTPLEPLHKATS